MLPANDEARRSSGLQYFADQALPRMSDLISTLLLLWFIAFALAGLDAFCRRAFGLGLLQATGIGWLIGLLR